MIRVMRGRGGPAAAGLGALIAATGLGALIAATAASTATLESLNVKKDDDLYSLYAETMLEASPEAIHEVLTDYERFNRISSVYKEHGYLEPLPDGTQVIFTTMRGCMLGYCKSMTRVERVEVSTPAHIRTVTIPERSDFKHAVSEWLIEPEGSGSRVIYTLEMEPDFWVPPLIGDWYLKRTLRRGGGDALERIERLAQEAQTEGAAPEGAAREVAALEKAALEKAALEKAALEKAAGEKAAGEDAAGQDAAGEDAAAQAALARRGG